MERTIIATDDAPAAIGPYSQGVVLGNLVFVSGQIPLDPVSGEVVAGGIEEQAHQVLTNLGAVLAAAGSSLEHAVKTTVYLSDMNTFAAMNSVYATFFSASPPARSTVQVARLPRDVLIEIDVIACLAP